VIVRYLRNLSVSLLEGSRTSDLREFSKFRDFSENRSVLFPSALATIASRHVEVVKMQKQLAQLEQHMPSTKPRTSNDKAAAGPQSTTSSTTDETPYYHDVYLNRLAVVVGNASKEAQHDPLPRHTSPSWKTNIVKYDKILLERDRNHINTHSCIERLLLHFYNRIEDAHERDAVDEDIELVLDFFADIQARLQYPSSPEIVSKISVCVRASRHRRSTGLDSIQGIPSAASELTDMITRLHEKLAEESFRSIYILHSRRE
jgi:hypothetical protein